jgi:hypothetical protein
MRAQLAEHSVQAPTFGPQFRELGAGQAPMTPTQAEYLLMLLAGTHEVLDDSLTRAEAARLIVRLEQARADRRRQRNSL